MNGSSKKLIVLQARDRVLLSELDVMRVIDRELAKIVAGFNSTSRANARLLALTQAGYLRRWFTGSIAGGRKAVYALSKLSTTVGSNSSGSVPRLLGKASYGGLFLEHQLHVNQIYAVAKHRSALVPECNFRRWITFSKVLSTSAPIIPDGYFELQHHEGIKPLFLEVDLGTEALRIWQKKIEGYLRFAVSGEFEKTFGQSQFRVLVVTDSARRSENIRRVAAKFTDKVFRFTSFESINREGLWSAIWQKPVGTQKESLL